MIMNAASLLKRLSVVAAGAGSPLAQAVFNSAKRDLDFFDGVVRRSLSLKAPHGRHSIFGGCASGFTTPTTKQTHAACKAQRGARPEGLFSVTTDAAMKPARAETQTPASVSPTSRSSSRMRPPVN